MSYTIVTELRTKIIRDYSARAIDYSRNAAVIDSHSYLEGKIGPDEEIELEDITKFINLSVSNNVEIILETDIDNSLTLSVKNNFLIYTELYRFTIKNTSANDITYKVIYE